jgi:hypothetical protein
LSAGDPLATLVVEDGIVPTRGGFDLAQHTYVLSRRVGRDPGLAEQAVAGLLDGEYAGLTFAGPFERRSIVGPWGSGPPEREAPGELATGARSAEHVVVELGAWARDAVELRVRPATRRPERWRGGRRRRYFEHGHDAIDALARALERETHELPTALPVTRSA